jgi:Rod binding domain-containing protein
MLSIKAAQDMDMVQHKMQVDALRKNLTPTQDPKAKLRETCEGFEAIFIQKMWDEMRKSVPKEGYLHSKDEQTYQSMFDHEFAKKMSSAGGIGLADMLYDQLAQTLGDSSRTTSPGLNPSLPIVPASSSPSNMRFTEQGGNAALNTSITPPAAKNVIKPVYEEINEAGHSAAGKISKTQDKAQDNALGSETSAAAVAAGEAQADSYMDFEELSQTLLREEQQSQAQTLNRQTNAARVNSWGGSKVHAPGAGTTSAQPTGRRVNRKI